MEMAHWHQFQVLTKRPERMAAFTQKRYKDKEPPPNIWMGTSVEDQQSFDDRIVHLRQVKAAIRWLSVEPLLGPIDCGALEGIHWLVGGGESGSKRPMDVDWIRAIRDACKKANVPFYFKQFSDVGMDGKRIPNPKGKGGKPPLLDGVRHDAFPDIPKRGHPAE